jgi:hypothetical protein
VINDEVLRLARSVTVDRHDDLRGFPADLTGVFLDKAVFAEIAGEAKLLILVFLASGNHNGMHRIRALRSALHRCALAGAVIG